MSLIYFVKNYVRRAYLRDIFRHSHLTTKIPSKEELFQKIVNTFKPFIIFPKSSTLNVWLSSGYGSVSKEM